MRKKPKNKIPRRARTERSRAVEMWVGNPGQGASRYVWREHDGTLALTTDAAFDSLSRVARCSYG